MKNIIWQIDNIRDVFEKYSFGDSIRMKDLITNTLNKYEKANVKDLECENRISILNKLLNEFSAG